MNKQQELKMAAEKLGLTMGVKQPVENPKWQEAIDAYNEKHGIYRVYRAFSAHTINKGGAMRIER